MAKDKCPECPECLPEWLAAFGDLMSLLLCFFILLLAMSSMDAIKVKEAIGSFQGTMGILPGSEALEANNKLGIPKETFAKNDPTSRDTLENIVTEVAEITQSANKDTVSLEDSEDGFLIRLPSELLFNEGSASIEYDDAFLFIKRMAMIIAKLPPDVEVAVRGHTDNANYPNSVYKDNWELSTARALSVLRELIKDGVDPKKLHAAGFADNIPLASNLTPEGRKKNRRVDLHFFSKNVKDKKDIKKSVLDTKTEAKQ